VVGRWISERGIGGSMPCVTFFHLYNEDKVFIISSPNISVYQCKTSYIIRLTLTAVTLVQLKNHKSRCRDSRHSDLFIIADNL